MTVLDNPRTLRQAYDDTHAEIDRLFKRIGEHYQAIDRFAERIRQLEERAAALGDELSRRTRLAPRDPWPFVGHRSQAEIDQPLSGS